MVPTRDILVDSFPRIMESTSPVISLLINSAGSRTILYELFYIIINAHQRALIFTKRCAIILSRSFPNRDRRATTDRSRKGRVNRFPRERLVYRFRYTISPRCLSLSIIPRSDNSFNNRIAGRAACKSNRARARAQP